MTPAAKIMSQLDLIVGGLEAMKIVPIRRYWMRNSHIWVTCEAMKTSKLPKIYIMKKFHELYGGNASLDFQVFKTFFFSHFSGT